MKLSKGIAIGTVILVGLVILAAAQIITGVSYQDAIYSNFWAFVFSLIAIAILSIVGAIFIGIYVSHSYFSARGFTPFEEEMLKMRADVKEIREKVEKLEKSLKIGEKAEKE
jgi:MFS superfamily sulfate permease-like transporter